MNPVLTTDHQGLLSVCLFDQQGNNCVLCRKYYKSFVRVVAFFNQFQGSKDIEWHKNTPFLTEEPIQMHRV